MTGCSWVSSLRDRYNHRRDLGSGVLESSVREGLNVAAGPAYYVAEILGGAVVPVGDAGRHNGNQQSTWCQKLQGVPKTVRMSDPG